MDRQPENMPLSACHSGLASGGIKTRLKTVSTCIKLSTIQNSYYKEQHRTIQVLSGRLNHFLSALLCT